MAPNRFGAIQGRTEQTPVPCGIKAFAETRKVWAMGAVAPALSRQRLKQKNENVIWE